MTARSFVLSVIAGASLLLGATLCANVLTDPQGVFGIDIVAQSADPNWRYLLFKQYERDAPNVDGIIFGSSRAAYIDSGAFGERIGGRQVLRFAVPYGLITDHLPFLLYVLNDKRARGEQLKSVLLLLDLDLFGKAPWTNSNINAFLPPAVSGKSIPRFWWRYLTAFQYRKWRDSVRLHNRDAATGLSGSIEKDVLSRHSAIAALPAIAIGGVGRASGQFKRLPRVSLPTRQSRCRTEAADPGMPIVRIWSARFPILHSSSSFVEATTLRSPSQRLRCRAQTWRAIPPAKWRR